MRHRNLNQLLLRRLHALQRDLVLQERRLSWCMDALVVTGRDYEY